MLRRKTNHAINQRKLSFFDANTQCLMRQDIRLLNKKLKAIIIIIIIIIIIYAKVIPPISCPTASNIFTIDITDFRFHIPQTTC
jgi:hypothetical protein